MNFTENIRNISAGEGSMIAAIVANESMASLLIPPEELSGEYGERRIRSISEGFLSELGGPAYCSHCLISRSPKVNASAFTVSSSVVDLHRSFLGRSERLMKELELTIGALASNQAKHSDVAFLAEIRATLAIHARSLCNLHLSQRTVLLGIRGSLGTTLDLFRVLGALEKAYPNMRTELANLRKSAETAYDRFSGMAKEIESA
jgi:hypothetical protein